MGEPVDYSQDDWAEGPGLMASIRHHARLVAVAVVAGACLALAWSLTRSTQYTGTVHVYIGGGTILQSLDPGRIVRSRAEILSSPVVLSQAARDIAAGMTEQQLRRLVEVTPSNDSDVITVTARGPSRREAAERADAVVRAYLVVMDQQAGETIRDGARVIDRRADVVARQLVTLRERVKANPVDEALAAEAEAKRNELRQLAKRKETLASTSPALDDSLALREKAVVAPDPMVPRPVRDSLVGATLGLILGSAVAWWLVGRNSVPTDASGQVSGNPVSKRREDDGWRRVWARRRDGRKARSAVKEPDPSAHPTAVPEVVVSANGTGKDTDTTGDPD